MQQLCLTSRLNAAKCSHATIFKDVANAFYSPHHRKLDQAIDLTARVEDKVLLKQRHTAACIQIHGRDGEILLAPGSRALQGDAFASELFLEEYHRLVDDWLAKLRTQPWYSLFDTVDPYSGQRVNTAMSTYADDLACKFPAASAHEMQSGTHDLDNMLDQALRRDTWLKIGISRRWWYTLLAVTHKNKCGKYITRWFPWKARLSQSQAIWERCFHTTVLQPQLVSTGCMLHKALGPAWDPSGVHLEFRSARCSRCSAAWWWKPFSQGSLLSYSMQRTILQSMRLLLRVEGNSCVERAARKSKRPLGRSSTRPFPTKMCSSSSALPARLWCSEFDGCNGGNDCCDFPVITRCCLQSSLAAVCNDVRKLFV